MSVQRDDIMGSARLAGCVVRYHTWPLVLPRETVGHHSWSVARIYMQIWGCLPQAVGEYIVWHDLPELHTGDVPYPVKSDNPALKTEMDRLEESGARALGGDVATRALSGLSPLQREQVKICDLMDMLELGHHELIMGNQLAQPIVDHVEGTINRMCDSSSLLDDGDCEAIARHMESVLGR